MSKDIFQTMMGGELGKMKYHLVIRYIGEGVMVKEDFIPDIEIDEAMTIIKRYADSGYTYMNFRMMKAHTED